MIIATLIEIEGGELQIPAIGTMQFLALPRVGDHIRVAAFPEAYYVTVVLVEHRPVSWPLEEYATPEPVVWVYVQTNSREDD